MRGIPFRYVYGTTKAAVIGLTKSVAADYIRKGIRVERDLPRHDRVALRSTTASRRWRRTPAGPRRRCGRSSSTASRWAGSAREEIAALAVYLASDEASYTTGQIHLADGGFAL